MMKLVEQLKDEREMLSANPSVSKLTLIDLQTALGMVGATSVILCLQMQNELTGGKCWKSQLISLFLVGIKSI